MVTPEQVQHYIFQGLQAQAVHCDVLRVSGDGHHFEALIVTDAFQGKRLIQRHQMIYAALGERMKAEIHALSMKTLTAAEYQDQSQSHTQP
jgi:acid stress-induced BolA-like protein IbaG/YrbA